MYAYHQGRNSTGAPSSAILSRRAAAAARWRRRPRPPLPPRNFRLAPPLLPLWFGRISLCCSSSGDESPPDDSSGVEVDAVADCMEDIEGGVRARAKVAALSTRMRATRAKSILGVRAYYSFGAFTTRSHVSFGPVKHVPARALYVRIPTATELGLPSFLGGPGKSALHALSSLHLTQSASVPIYDAMLSPRAPVQSNRLSLFLLLSI